MPQVTLKDGRIIDHWNMVEGLQSLGFTWNPEENCWYQPDGHKSHADIITLTRLATRVSSIHNRTAYGEYSLLYEES